MSVSQKVVVFLFRSSDSLVPSSSLTFFGGGDPDPLSFFLFLNLWNFSILRHLDFETGKTSRPRSQKFLVLLPPRRSQPFRRLPTPSFLDRYGPTPSQRSRARAPPFVCLSQFREKEDGVSEGVYGEPYRIVPHRPFRLHIKRLGLGRRGSPLLIHPNLDSLSLNYRPWSLQGRDSDRGARPEDPEKDEKWQKLCRK